ncbi:hypothetical protein FQN50_007646 [Emmonsiellopsis sp. PD_5]|nr:hypothetical protein FQN50_007646 [Emmonsiellopsis sp. PD_5]
MFASGAGSKDKLQEQIPKEMPGLGRVTQRVRRCLWRCSSLAKERLQYSQDKDLREAELFFLRTRPAAVRLASMVVRSLRWGEPRLYTMKRGELEEESEGSGVGRVTADINFNLLQHATVDADIGSSRASDCNTVPAVPKDARGSTWAVSRRINELSRITSLPGKPAESSPPPCNLIRPSAGVRITSFQSGLSRPGFCLGRCSSHSPCLSSGNILARYSSSTCGFSARYSGSDLDQLCAKMSQDGVNHKQEALQSGVESSASGY